MPFDVVWSELAKSDLDGLYNYYLQISVNLAVKIHNGIINESERLISSPEIAPFEQIIKKPSKKYRSLLVSKGRFKLVYYVMGNSVKIVCVWGCRQNPARLRKTVKNR
jgi:Plasmid stabilization system protein